jgi:hypothetical protein
MSASREQFELSSVEKGSQVWLKIEGYLKQRLERLRLRNDKHLSPEETAQVRGEIAALKALLRLGSEPMPPIDG